MSFQNLMRMNSPKNKLTEDDYRRSIENCICAYVPQSSYGNSAVYDAAIYSLMNGGKRIRPLLVLEACRICGGDYMKAMPFAAAIEMIHTYSLIHDDLPCMDDDDYRRGKPSCHVAFGEDVAVLAGDALLTQAFSAVSESEIARERPDIAVKAIAALSRYSGINGMIGGQILDLSNENRAVSAENVDLCNSLKTGALIRCAVYIGAICADADAAAIKALDDYALNIGKAFQIVDDILNVVGDEKLLGKPTGSDSEKGKTKYVTLLGLDGARETAEKLTENAVKALECFADEGDFLKNIAYSLIKRSN